MAGKRLYNSKHGVNGPTSTVRSLHAGACCVGAWCWPWHVADKRKGVRHKRMPSVAVVTDPSVLAMFGHVANGNHTTCRKQICGATHELIEARHAKAT